MNILVFTKNWLGDVVLEEPAIRAIKKNAPHARLIVATSPRCVEILKANPWVDEVIAFDEKTTHRNFFARLAFAATLRRKEIEKVFFFHRSSTRVWISFLAGISERIGYANKKRNFLLTKPIPDPRQQTEDGRRKTEGGRRGQGEELLASPPNDVGRIRPSADNFQLRTFRTEPATGQIHDVQYFVDLVRDAGFQTTEDYQYEFYFTDEDETLSLELLSQSGLSLNAGPLVAVNPGANWAPKRWPVRYYRELVEKLVERYRVRVLITGSREDLPVADSILSGLNGSPVYSVCGKTRICELGAIFSKCRLVISNDSGPLHIATGVGTNVIGIFGPTAPLETAPMGRGRNVVIHYAPEGVRLPWKGKHFPYGDWMERIHVDDVLEVIRRENLLDEHETP